MKLKKAKKIAKRYSKFGDKYAAVTKPFAGKKSFCVVYTLLCCNNQRSNNNLLIGYYNGRKIK